MRNTLLAIVLLLVGMIYVVADFLGGRSPGFPDAAQFSRLISIREPQNFTDLVAESIGGGELGGGDLRGVWAALDEASRGAGPSDQSSIEAIRGTILGNYGHPDRAIPMLSRALKGSQNLDERADILAQLYGACRNTGYYETFRIAVENKDLKAAFPAQIADYLKKLTGAQAGIDQKRRLKMLLAWLVLLLLPWFVSEIRCRRWLKRFPTEQERPGPYFAFVRSVIGTILCLFSSVMVLFWNLPAALGYSHSLVLAFLHLLAAGLFSLYPFYHLDREVRQTSWSFFAYFAVFIRMSLLNSIVLIIPSYITGNDRCLAFVAGDLAPGSWPRISGSLRGNAVDSSGIHTNIVGPLASESAANAALGQGFKSSSLQVEPDGRENFQCAQFWVFQPDSGDRGNHAAGR